MDREKQFETKLRQLPSNFDIFELEDVHKLSHQYVTMRREKLIGDSESINVDTDMQICRIWNLISFLCFILNDTKKALEYNSKVLERWKDNITALSNKAWIFLKEKERYNDVEKICEKLEHIKQSEWNVLIAKADVAYSLTKLGTQFYQRASQKYRDILEKCYIKSDTGKSDDLPFCESHMEEVSEWMFDLAQTEKGLLNFHNTNDDAFSDLTLKHYKDVSEYFVRIINSKSENECMKRLKAKAYVELGLLAHTAELNSILFPNGMKDLLPEHEVLWMKTDTFFTLAIDIFPADVFVLERSGKYFRYAKDLPKSISLLEKAIQLKETSFGHHHLALSLKRQLESPRRLRQDQYYAASRELQNVTKNLFSGHIENTTLASSEHTRQEWNSPRLLPEHQIDRFFKKYESSTPVDMETCSTNQEKYNQNTTNLNEHYHFEKSGQWKKRNESFEHNLKTMSLHSNSDLNKITECDAQTRELSEQQERRIPTSDATFQRQQKFILNQPELEHSKDIKSGFCYRSISESATQSNSKNYGHIIHRELGRLFSLDEREFRNRSEFSKKQTAIKLSIKSPRKARYIDKNKEMKTIQEIIYHLDRSFEMTGNCGALYDKGLLFRATRETDKALEIFKFLIKNTNKQCYSVMLSNAYEQAGLCLYEMITENPIETETEYIHLLEDDMKMYLRYSIEISCRLFAKIPFLKDCWESAPTLHSLLRGEAKTKEQQKEKLKDLVFLCKKFENYGATIDVLKQLIELANDDAEKVNVLEDIVQQHLNDRNYDDAVVAMEVLTCLPNGCSFIKRSLISEVYVLGGMSTLKTGHKDIARQRFSQVIDLAGNSNVVAVANNDFDADNSTESNDIIIVCDKYNETNGVILKRIFKTFALTATVNSEGVRPGFRILKGFENSVKCSKHVVVVYDIIPENKASVEELEFRFSLVLQIIKESGHKNIVIVTDNSISTLPNLMSVFKSVEFSFNEGFEEDGDELINNDKVCEKMKEILFLLSK